jgi:hypothetical protein
MRRSLLATPVAVAAVLFIGGCHHGGSEDVTPSAQPSAATKGMDTTAAGAASAAGAAKDTAAAAAAGMHDTAAMTADSMHHAADSLGAKADSTMKRDSM